LKKYSSLSLKNYLQALSQGSPIPGGGSAAAYVACLGMGLGEMAAAIGLKKAAPESQPAVRKAVQLLRKTRRRALQVVDLDPRVYQGVMDSYKKARSTADQKKKERLIDDALENAFRLQADLALLVVMAKEAVQGIEGLIKGAIQNDLKVSKAFLGAAFQGSCDTAHINVVYLKNPQNKQRAGQALEELEKRFETGSSGN